MAMIYVKAKQGRVAYYEGRIIPHDQFIPVVDDPYIRRLVDHWDDLEVQGGADTAAAPAPARKLGTHTPAGARDPSPTMPPTSPNPTSNKPN